MPHERTVDCADHPDHSDHPAEHANLLGNDLTFTACGRAWRIRRADLEALWENMGSESDPLWQQWQDDERLPYWAELWPSSLALAEWLATHQADISHKNCLDMGCGLGFTALVGQGLGGRVIGMDYDAEALHYAKINAELNAIPGVTWVVMDWREPAIPAGSLDVIWAGDIVYERRFAQPIAAFLAHALNPTGKAWLAEPGRLIFSALLDELPKHGLTFTKVHHAPTWPLVPQAVPAPVSIWEVRKISTETGAC